MVAQSGLRRPLTLLSGSSASPQTDSSLSQLQDVVGGTDERPFGPHLLEAAKELAEAARFCDLPKYRLGQLLTQRAARRRFSGKCAKN